MVGINVRIERWVREMWSEYTDMIYEQIGETVRDTQRHLRRGVLPRDVQARLPYARAEGSVRRDMGTMAQAGRLVRLGGDGARRGYRVPTLMERMCYQMLGVFPHGAEMVHPTLLSVR